MRKIEIGLQRWLSSQKYLFLFRRTKIPVPRIHKSGLKISCNYNSRRYEFFWPPQTDTHVHKKSFVKKMEYDKNLSVTTNKKVQYLIVVIPAPRRLR